MDYKLPSSVEKSFKFSIQPYTIEDFVLQPVKSQHLKAALNIVQIEEGDRVDTKILKWKATECVSLVGTELH